MFQNTHSLLVSVGLVFPVLATIIFQDRKNLGWLTSLKMGATVVGTIALYFILFGL